MTENNEKNLNREAINDQETEQVSGGRGTIFGTSAPGSVLQFGNPIKAIPCPICGVYGHDAFKCPNRDSGSST